MIVASCRQEVLKPIVILDTVEVVDDLVFWKWPMSSLPDNMVLSFIRSRTTLVLGTDIDIPV